MVHFKIRSLSNFRSVGNMLAARADMKTTWLNSQILKSDTFSHELPTLLYCEDLERFTSL